MPQEPDYAALDYAALDFALRPGNNEIVFRKSERLARKPSRAWIARSIPAAGHRTPLELLDQTELWSSAGGVRFVSELSISHAVNLRAWLLDNAYEFAYVAGRQFPLPYTPSACDVERWMREKPLFKAIAARLKLGEEVNIMGEAPTLKLKRSELIAKLSTKRDELLAEREAEEATVDARLSAVLEEMPTRGKMLLADELESGLERDAVMMSDPGKVSYFQQHTPGDISELDRNIALLELGAEDVIELSRTDSLLRYF